LKSQEKYLTDRGASDTIQVTDIDVRRLRGLEPRVLEFEDMTISRLSRTARAWPDVWVRTGGPRPVPILNLGWITSALRAAPPEKSCAGASKYAASQSA
jgi:hypothetical protein